MGILGSILKPAFEVYDKLSDSGEYDDIQQLEEVRKAAKRSKSYLSKALNLLFFAVLFFAGLSIWALIDRPSPDVLDRERQDHDETKAELKEARLFIQNMVPLSEREKAKTTEIKEQVDSIKSEIEGLNPVVHSYNSNYKKIKKNAK